MTASPAPASVGADVGASGSGRRTLGLVVGAVGVVGLGIGTGFALSAKSKYDESVGFVAAPTTRTSAPSRALRCGIELAARATSPRLRSAWVELRSLRARFCSLRRPLRPARPRGFGSCQRPVPVRQGSSWSVRTSTTLCRRRPSPDPSSRVSAFRGRWRASKHVGARASVCRFLSRSPRPA